MPLFKYRAKKGPHDVAEGVIEAPSEKEAVEKLSKMGYIPVSVREEASLSGTPKTHFSKKRSGRVRNREITVFTRELASLLKSGVPILKALAIIEEQAENRYLKEVFSYIHDAVKEGATFSSALGEIPRVFPPLYREMVRTGENSGALPEALMRVAEHRTKQEEMLSRFRMAMAYPLLMATVGLGTLIFMFTFVVPRLTRIYMTMEQSLPLPTKILISISEAVRAHWFWGILAIAVIVLVFIREAKTKVGRLSISAFSLHVPVFGEFIRKSELSRFSRTLGLLIKSGLPILNAIDISIPVLENEVIKNHLRKSHADLEQGGSFGKSLRGSRSVPKFMSNLVSVGEESGRLDEALEEVANAYERDTNEMIQICGNLLEPVVILVMGLVVGFIVVAMLLPIFEIDIMAR
jgi:general secretion pathway protein F